MNDSPRDSEPPLNLSDFNPDDHNAKTYQVGGVTVSELQTSDPCPIFYLQPEKLIEDDHWIEFCKNFSAASRLTHVRIIIEGRSGRLATTLESIKAGMKMAKNTGIKTVTWAYLTEDEAYGSLARLIESAYEEFNIKAKSKTFAEFDAALAWTNTLINKSGY